MGDKDTKSDFNFEKFNKKLLNAKSSKNLLKARDILDSCMGTLNKQLPNFNPDLKSQVNALIEANKQSIKKTTDEFLGKIGKIEDSFKSRDFINIPAELDRIKTSVKESGINELLNNIKFLKNKTEKSIQAKRNLEQYEIPVPSGIEPDKLELKFYSINNLLNDVQKEKVVHPEIITKIEEIHTIYQNSMKEHGLEDTKKSIGKNLKLKAKVLSESRNINKINKKFDDNLSSAKNTSDLLKAKEFLGFADEILKENDLKVIYQDKQEEYYVFLKKVDSLIEKWTNDTGSIIKNSKELMEKFQYSDARMTLLKLDEDLKKNGLINLVDSVTNEIDICKVNEQIYNDYQAINQIYESKSYFNAKNKLESLNQLIQTKFSSVEIVKSNEEQLNLLNNKISDARNKEEAELKEEIEKIWDDLKESLDFDANKKDLDTKRVFADQNGYPSLISIIDNYSTEFDLNLQIFNLYNGLTQSLKEEKINHVKVELGKVNSNISQKSDAYFSKIKEKYLELEKETDDQISNEKTKIIQKIDGIEVIIDEKNDIITSQNTIGEIKNRINQTGLSEFRSLLNPIVQKIELNMEAVNIQQEIQKKIAEDQLKIGEIEYIKLLEKINTTLEKTPKIYSSTLKSNLENELVELQSKIVDLTSKLNEEYNKLDGIIKKTLDFSKVQADLKTYKDRANKLGLDDLIKDINDLDQKCSKNTEFVSEYNQVLTNYENLVDFVSTIEAIYKLYETSGKEEKSFDHVKVNIQKLHERVKSESEKREVKVTNAHNKIIKTEVKTLQFLKAIESLTQNLAMAENLNVPSIIPEIKQYINFCSRCLPILENLDGIEADLNSGNVIEARNNITSIKPNLPLGKEKLEEITNIITLRWEKLHKSIESEIESHIGILKGKIPRLVALVENKKTNEARSSLLAVRDRAQYLGVGMTVAEINDLLKICDFQSTPASAVSKKKKKQKNVKKTEPQHKKDAFKIEEPENIEGTMIVKHAKPESFKSESPNVSTTQRPRSTVRRSPKKAVQVCKYCKASQPTDHERYCFFCGKQL